MATTSTLCAHTVKDKDAAINAPVYQYLELRAPPTPPRAQIARIPSFLSFFLGNSSGEKGDWEAPLSRSCSNIFFLRKKTRFFIIVCDFYWQLFRIMSATCLICSNFDQTFDQTSGSALNAEGTMPYPFRWRWDKRDFLLLLATQFFLSLEEEEMPNTRTYVVVQRD